jgi:hypothetical protein
MDSFMTTDGTYNLLDTGYPCLNVGTVDSNHHFKRAGLCVSRHQNTDSFKLLFENIKTSIHMFFASRFQCCMLAQILPQKSIML